MCECYRVMEFFLARDLTFRAEARSAQFSAHIRSRAQKWVITRFHTSNLFGHYIKIT